MILKEINKTKRLLKTYRTTFKEYMKDSGRRSDIDLGDNIHNKSLGSGVVVGWNRSSNYNIIFNDTPSEICNIHPSEAETL